MASDSGTAERSNRATIVGAFCCGALTGAVVATLFAPARGRATRERLLAKARHVTETKDVYLEQLEAQLQNWSARVDRLAAKANQAAAGTKVEYEKQLADLRMRLDDARHRLSGLRAAGEDAWRELAAGAQRAWQELRQALDSAITKLS